ncbi:MAG: hypothetical protein NVSMB24_08230 [Mucilaginibacter sp.]
MDWDLQTIDGWKKLGYYYEYDTSLKQWRLYGSKLGLKSLVAQIENYTNNPENTGISEHMHLGPHNYLKILTWYNPIISEDHIGGLLSDLKKFNEILIKKLSSSRIGEVFKIGTEYSSDTTITMLFFVMNNNFDPSFIEYAK